MQAPKVDIFVVIVELYDVVVVLVRIEVFQSRNLGGPSPSSAKFDD